jgi:hypothetical protein
MGVGVVANAANIPIGSSISATTSVTNRPDSSAHSQIWADDAFSRHATVRLLGEVSLSNCGGSTPTGHCYRWSGRIVDTGTFTTRTGILSPGFGYLNGGSDPALLEHVTGPMNGKANYSYFSSWKSASTKNMPTHMSGAASGRTTTSLWVEQFYGASALFWNSAGVPQGSGGSLLTSGGWAYLAPTGSDPACPNVTSSWLDASPSWGSHAVDGNILAPDAVHC